MSARRWQVVLVVVSTAILIQVFQERFKRLEPAIMRARAAQWTLTTRWMMERYGAQHGQYVTCGGEAPPCWRPLGWMNFPRHLKGYELRVALAGEGYEVVARGLEGSWRLSRGAALQWDEALRLSSEEARALEAQPKRRRKK